MTSEALYLDLLKRCLTRALFRTAPPPPTWMDKARRGVADALRARASGLYARLLRVGPLRSAATFMARWLQRTFIRIAPPEPHALDEGSVWPQDAETMIGREAAG